MRVLSFRADGYRNLRPEPFVPGDGVNVLHGGNAQGKTNLLEGIWLFTGSRGFRNAKERELVTFDRERAELSLAFMAEEREQYAEIRIEQRRAARLNGIPQPAASRLAGHFRCVLFVPGHLLLIQSGPEQRRRFLDGAYCQLKPGYIPVLSEYTRTLSQRNALLRQMAAHTTADTGQLDAWDQRLAVAGARVILARAAYIQKLSPLSADIYAGLSGGRETLSLRYIATEGVDIGTLSLQELAGQLFDRLVSARRTDIAAGCSLIGPHREDLAVTIGGVPARVYGSQGQQRSAVLSLKLAEATLLREVTGEQPVALLDDVMSELDETRQDYILNHIHGWQVFITCCEPSAVLRMTSGASFLVESGRVVREN